MTITQIIERERASLRRMHLVAGVAVALAATTMVVAAAAVLLGGSRWMALPRAVPFIAWGVIVAINVLALIVTRRVVRRETSIGEVAAAVEREQSLRSGSVRGTMEVADGGALGQRAASRLGAQLRGAGPVLLPATRGRARRRLSRVGLAAVIAVVAILAVGPVFGDGLVAVMRPVDAWRGTLLPAISFENLPTAVVRGEPLRLHVLAKGRRVVWIDRRANGEGWHSDQIAPDAKGRATLDLGPMTGDLRLVASDGRARTDTVMIRVADRPFLGGIAVRAVYPAYLGREPEGLATGEPASVPAGTMLEISGRASTDLNEVKLVSEHASSADVTELTPSGHAFRGRLVPRASGAWRWVAAGAAGAVTDVPPPLEVEVVPDSVPRVEILSPMQDTLVAPGAKVTLRMAAMDDHGLSAVDIVSWPSTNGKPGERLTTSVADRPGAAWSTSILLDVAARGLEAGDVLHLKVTARDNSPWAQRGESRELLVRVATSEEQRDMARTTGDSAVADADAAVKAQKALERRAAEAAQDRASAASPDGKDGDKMGFEAAQKAKALAQDQRAMANQVKQLSDVAKALEQQLREAGALDSSLARQLQEAQAMLREALTSEMLEQMKKLEQGAQDLSRGDVQQSLAALREQQRRMREQLEKSAEMLRRASMEGAMQTLSDEAKDLAKQQRALADSAAKPDADKRQTAQELADRTDRLGKQMDKLQDRLANAKAETGAAKTQEARQNAQSAEDKLKAGSESAAASDMQKAADAMKQARDGQVQEWKKELTSALDQSIQEMLQMSREENALQQQVRSGQAKPEDARGQQSALKQGLDAASQRLQREAQKSSLLSGRSQRAVADAQQKVDLATQAASDPRTSQQSGQSMNEAAEALNKAAASLARDRERANTASSASGFAEMIQQMQEMAGKQGNINSQAQSLMPQPGSAMSQMAQAQSRALARQQRQIADKLDELSDAAAGDKAAKMAQEARQLADVLDGSRIDASTLARQQQLFKKMLDAGRSLEKEDREESEKREAKAAVDPKLFSPQAGTAKGKDAARFREPTWDELRGLSADERRIILEYFKKLNGRGG